MRLARWLLPAAALAVACTKYHPQPLSPEASATAFGHRTLGDTALTSFLTTYDSTRSTNWDPQRLALTAWYFRPDLEVQRRTWRTAQAAEITAGMRPPIGVAGAVERADNSGPFAAPWTVTLGLVFRIELGGKRGARIAAARARALVTELQTRVVAWDIASDVRSAALTVVQSDSSIAAWSRRVARSQQVADQVDRLYQADAIGQSTVDQAASEVTTMAPRKTAKPAKPVRKRAKRAMASGASAPTLPKTMLTGKASAAKAADGDKPVLAYIASLPQPQRGIAERIDALAARTLPNLQRAVKWGMSYYGVGDGWCFSCGGFAKHVKLMFVNGVALKPYRR
jgi:hypothetical protein